VLKPEIAAYLEAGSQAGLPAVWETSIATFRKNGENRPAQSGVPEEINTLRHRFIPGPTADLPIRIYRPHPTMVLPVLIWFHGGGWATSHLDVYEQAMRSMSNRGEFAVIAVNYQKSPEHKFPIPFDDCYATMLWVRDNAQALNIDPTHIGVGGDSAGGNLAAAVALKARDTGDLRLAFQLLVYPCNDPAMNYESAERNATGYGLTTRAMKYFWELYVDKKSDFSHPYCAPVTAKNFAGLAPAIIITAEYDTLLDDGSNYAELLKGAGNTVIYREYPGQMHGFFVLAAITPDALIAQEFAAREINALLDR
jgi:acetyl esterase